MFSRENCSEQALATSEIGKFEWPAAREASLRQERTLSREASPPGSASIRRKRSSLSIVDAPAQACIVSPESNADAGVAKTMRENAPAERKRISTASKDEELVAGRGVHIEVGSVGAWVRANFQITSGSTRELN